MIVATFRKIWLAFFFLLCTLCVNWAHAQQSITWNFENWNPSGQPAPFDWEQPSNWTSNNALTEFVGAAVRKAQSPCQGTFSANLRTQSIFSDTVPGALVLGNVPIDYTLGFLKYELGGLPLGVLSPDSLTGFYRYDAAGGLDTGEVTVRIRRYENGNILYIAEGYTKLPPAAACTRFSLPIAYTDVPLATDSVVIIFHSSLFYTNSLVGHPGSNLTIDSVSLIGRTNTSVEPNPAAVRIQAYPNPTTDAVKVYVQGVNGNCAIKLRDIVGLTLGEFRVNAIHGAAYQDISLAKYSNGIYTIEIEQNGRRYHQKIIKN